MHFNRIVSDFSDKAGIQEESRAFLLHQSYDDALTVKLVSTACEILGNSINQYTNVSKVFDLFLILLI